MTCFTCIYICRFRLLNCIHFGFILLHCCNCNYLLKWDCFEPHAQIQIPPVIKWIESLSLGTKQTVGFFFMNTHKCKARLLNFNRSSLPCDVANSSCFWNFTGSDPENQYHAVGVQERERWHLFSDQQSNSAIETFRKLGYSLQNLITIGKKYWQQFF